MTPKIVSLVPEVLEVHEIPSDEVKIIPNSPTATNSPFPKVTFLSKKEVPEVLEVHEVPSEEVRIVPLEPTVTKSPFT